MRGFVEEAPASTWRREETNRDGGFDPQHIHVRGALWLSAEVELLNRLLFKFKNQHRRAVFYVKARRVLVACRALLRVLSEQTQSLRREDRRAFLETKHGGSLVAKQVIACFQGQRRLLQVACDANEALQHAASAASQLLQRGFLLTATLPLLAVYGRLVSLTLSLTAAAEQRLYGDAELLDHPLLRRLFPAADSRPAAAALEAKSAAEAAAAAAAAAAAETAAAARLQSSLWKGLAAGQDGREGKYETGEREGNGASGKAGSENTNTTATAAVAAAAAAATLIRWRLGSASASSVKNNCIKGEAEADFAAGGAGGGGASGFEAYAGGEETRRTPIHEEAAANAATAEAAAEAVATANAIEAAVAFNVFEAPTSSEVPPSEDEDEDEEPEEEDDVGEQQSNYGGAEGEAEEVRDAFGEDERTIFDVEEDTVDSDSAETFFILKNSPPLPVPPAPSPQSLSQAFAAAASQAPPRLLPCSVTEEAVARERASAAAAAAAAAEAQFFL